jgi:hypothetical protein
MVKQAFLGLAHCCNYQRKVVLKILTAFCAALLGSSTDNFL